MNQIKLDESLKKSINKATLFNMFVTPCPICQRTRASTKALKLTPNGMIYKLNSHNPFTRINYHGHEEIFCSMEHFQKWLVKKGVES